MLQKILLFNTKEIESQGQFLIFGGFVALRAYSITFNGEILVVRYKYMDIKMSQLNVNTIGARTGTGDNNCSGDNFYIPGHILQAVSATDTTSSYSIANQSKVR